MVNINTATVITKRFIDTSVLPSIFMFKSWMTENRGKILIAIILVEISLRVVPSERVRSLFYYFRNLILFAFRIVDACIWRVSSTISWVIPDLRKYPQNNPPNIWRYLWRFLSGRRR